MSKQSVAEWISVILCLSGSPVMLLFLIAGAQETSKECEMHIILALILYVIIGLALLGITVKLLSKLIYFIIK